jgi:AcrR family transcriptional regulator
MIVESPPSRVRRRQERNREALLKAARALMARHGYEKTTIAAITKAADLGFGTFYLYFPGKPAILREIVDDAVRRQLDELRAIAREATPPDETVQRVIASVVHSAAANRDLFQIMYLQGDSRHRHLMTVRDELIRTLEDAVTRGVRDGRFHDVHPGLAARAIVGTVTAALLWVARDRTAPRTGLSDSIARLALGGLNGGANPRAGEEGTT